MPSVELVYENTCPNVDATRVRLAQAFQAAGIAPAWSEWEVGDPQAPEHVRRRSEEHTSELQSLMRISYAVFCLKKKKKTNKITNNSIRTVKRISKSRN